MARRVVRAVVAAALGACAAVAPVACNGLLGNEDIVYTDDAALEGGPGADALATKEGAAGDSSAEPCPAAACERLVFVTSTVSTGELGGLAGADGICQKRADAPGSVVRGHQFIAWLSDFGTFVRDRHFPGTNAYKRSDGTIIAASWNELVSGKLRVPIDHDETGKPRSTPLAEVWTGSNADGMRQLPVCNDWATASSEYAATTGTFSAVDGTWSNNGTVHVCSTAAALYCIER